VKEHYSNQRGHYERGVANRFKEQTGHKPVVLKAIIEPNKRRMRRIVRDGKGVRA
jgi:hypothetical protein